MGSISRAEIDYKVLEILNSDNFRELTSGSEVTVRLDTNLDRVVGLDSFDVRNLAKILEGTFDMGVIPEWDAEFFLRGPEGVDLVPEVSLEGLDVYASAGNVARYVERRLAGAGRFTQLPR